MAKKPVTRTKKTSRTTTKKPVKVTKVIKPGRSKRAIVVVAVLLFAAVGTYFIVAGNAQSQKLEDEIARIQKGDPGRGVIYSASEKIQSKGPCKGQLEDVDAKGKKSCAHKDPTPHKKDALAVEADLLAQMEADKKVTPLAWNAPLEDPADAVQETSSTAAQTSTASSSTTNSDKSTNVYADTDQYRGALGDFVTPRDFPCINDGQDGTRIRVLYAYSDKSSSRLSTFRTFFENSMRRVENIAYSSSGGHRLYRFLTNSSCGLAIPSAIPISGDITDYKNVKAQAAAKGFDVLGRKYFVYVDTAGTGIPYADIPCGLAQTPPYDEKDPAANFNDTEKDYSFVWTKCWNYGEPHEIMHMLGAVQSSSPHSQGGHCYDLHDVMCYSSDAVGTPNPIICARQVARWRYDCNKDDYFSMSPAPGSYLDTHWNTADSIFFYKF